MDPLLPEPGRRVRNRSYIIAVVLLVIASARIVSTYKVFNFTIDEPAHIACGMEWLQAGTYHYEVQHPPLARVVAALGVQYAGNRWDRDTNMWYSGFRLLGGGKGERGLVFGRAAMLPFFWIACGVVFLWAHRIGGATAATMSLLLFTTLPPILAHASLITTDMALTAFTGAAALSALYWAAKPVLPRAILLGINLGLAVLSKLSAIPFLPFAGAFVYVGYLVSHRPGFRVALHEIRVRVPSALLAVFTSALVIWAGYRFTFQTTAMFPFPVPAPELFAGIQAVWKHNSEGHLSYLLGGRSLHGFWFYYPVTFGVKTPAAMLILFMLSLGAAVRKQLHILTPLLFSFGTISFALLSNINIGIRHVLPVYLGVSVAIGAAVAAIMRSRPPRWVSITLYTLLALHVLSGALQHPDYLAYTNEFFWNNPERVLADSDVDWGQDMKRLGERMEQMGVETIHFEPFNRGYLVDRQFPKLLPVPSGDHPPSGWTAVSISMWKLAGGPHWLETTPPTAKIGRSIFLYHATHVLAEADVSPPTAPILLFNGTGASPEDVAALEVILKNNHLRYMTVKSSPLNLMNQSQIRQYRLLIVPGGNFVEIGKSLTAGATANINQAVQDGLNYLGVCAGGFLAGKYNPPYNGLNLTSGVRFAFYAAESRGIHKAAVSIAVAGEPTLDQYWEDGPEFTGWGAVIGKYPDGTPAVVEGTFGKGRVILSGVHPEAPESWRRGMTLKTPASMDNAYAGKLILAALNGASLSH